MAAAPLAPQPADPTTVRLLGDVAGKRVLDLGSGNGQNAVALAAQGAKVIAVDPSAEQLAVARAAADAAAVKVELHQADLHEVAFVRADSIDIAYSSYGLTNVHDLSRVFRQAHRVLRPDAPLVVALPHPAVTLIDPTADDPLRVRYSWFDRSERHYGEGRDAFHVQARTMQDIFASLIRSNFRVDLLIEPEPTGPDGEPTAPHPERVTDWVPATVILRGRKLGI
jgi:ubiquinone/menaquinone biosynthesis C-methylase UbiE